MALHPHIREVHIPGYVQATDPALDPANGVAADELWIDKSSGPPYALWVRNTGNTAWEAVGVGAPSGAVTVGGELLTAGGDVVVAA